MDLKTGRAKSPEQIILDRRAWQNDQSYFRFELVGGHNESSDNTWKCRSSGETSANFSQTFGDGGAYTATPSLDQADGKNPAQFAEFITGDRGLVIEDVKIVMSKNGGAADSTLKIAVLTVPITYGSEVTTYASSVIASVGSLHCPNDTDVYQAHDLNSTFKNKELPKNSMVFVAIADETGGTGNQIFFHGHIVCKYI